MKVKLVEYNPDWVKLFNEEKAIIKKALTSLNTRIEHIGSTSVPALGAKPIVDILLGVRSESDLNALIPLMTGIGYEYRNNFEHVMPYRRYFTKPGNFHVHSVVVTGEFWKRHITFRDYLRTHDETRDEYFKVKKNLSDKEWDDSNDYAYAKTEFIQGIEKKAKEYISGKIEITEAEALTDIYYNMPADIAKQNDIEFLYANKVLAMKSGKIPAIIVNRIIGLGINNEVTPDDLHNLFNFYKNHPNPVNISLAPYTKPENLKEILIKKGFPNRENWNKFYRNCEPVPEAETSLKVAEINEDYADDFAEIVVKVFNNPPELKYNASKLVGRKNWHHYLAFENSKPVAAGSVYINGDTAWFGMATTLPECRNKGAQSAIIAKRINKAHELGCKWISVETAPHSSTEPNPSYLNLLKYGFNFLYERPNFMLNSA
ncbi:MAG: hypothetical protein EHM58_14000 [Ignavibacteriae bacterium]|nr:MAG: hypothetical protein EHM58_14000 [Ignavibacteriota bacterium]